MSISTEEQFALLKAAEAGDEVKIKDILFKGVDINIDLVGGKSILHVAAAYGYENLVDFLCRSGADINKKDCSGRTPIYSAISGLIWKDNPSTVKKRVNIIESLINNGSEVNYACNLDRTALFYAIEESLDIIPNSPESHERFMNFVRITEMLLKKGASANSQDYKGSTPLHRAVVIKEFRPEIVRLLLDYGADVNAVDKFGTTPIFYVQNDMVLEMLIKRGANINHVCKLYFTPLLRKVKLKQSLRVQVLLRNGADVNIENPQWETALETYRSPYSCEDYTWLESMINQSVDLNFIIRRLGKLDKCFSFISNFTAIIVKRKVAEKISIDIESLKPNDPNSIYKAFCSIVSMCELEIVKMKETKIDIGELSVFDILMMPIHKLMYYVERKELLILESDSTSNDYPIYAEMLKRHIKEARTRRYLIDSSAGAFKKLIFNFHKIKLPDLVVYKIVPMLSNGYLTALAQV